MTEERCEPPPELRGVDGWHHVNAAGIERPIWWSASAIIPANANYMEFAPAWIAPGGGRVGPVVAYCRNWRYIAPVVTPADVDALRAERDAWEQSAKTTADDAIKQITKIGIELTTLRARVAESEAARGQALALLVAMQSWIAVTPSQIHMQLTDIRAALEGKP